MTDRPDQTESAVVVPPGFVQVESGIDGAEESGDPEREAVAVGSTLVRIGVVEGVELRLGWAGWQREEAGDVSDDGAGDGEVGVKVLLAEGRGARPQAALLAGVSVPVGESGRSSGRYDPALRLAFAHDLPAGVGLGYNLGMAWAGEESRLEYTVTAGFGLGERLGAFVELFGDAPVDAAGGAAGPAHAADAGLTLLLSPRLQLDLAAGAGLSDEAPDRFFTAGLSVRWPR